MQHQPVRLLFLLLALALGGPTAASTDSTARNALETVQDWRQAMPPGNSALKQAMVQARKSRLGLSPELQFDLEELHGTLQPVQADTPISLENTSAFGVQISHARLKISDAVLQTLVQAELNASNAPLRIKQVQTKPDGVLIKGDIRRLGLWIPFEMEGAPSVLNNKEIGLTPSRLKVAGIPVYKALLATNIQLQALIDMKSKAVRLQGQAMVLRLDSLLQAPKISFELSKVELAQGEVKVLLGASNSPPFFCGAQCPGSFIYTAGGELRAAGMVLSGKPTLITGTPSSTLPVGLHQLDPLIQTSTMQLRADGAIWISAQEGQLGEDEAALLAKGDQAMKRLKQQLETYAQQQPVTLAVHEATLLSNEGIELRVEKLLASTHATDLGQLPTAPQTVHTGEISLGEKALNTLMNEALFNYEGSPIRRVNSRIGSPLLELALQVRPEILGIPLIWLPATLSGELQVSDDQLHLEFTPTQVRMFGLPVLPLLNFLGLPLDSLIKIDQQTIKLTGNTLRIALNNALPPLQLNTRLLAIKTGGSSPWGPFLQVSVGLQAEDARLETQSLMEQLPKGLWMNTPEFTALGMRTGPTLGHVYNARRDERLVIDLAQYPDLLSAATIRLPERERVWVSMPPQR
ncbi:MAG: hypothetical protein O9274_10050 [Limnobacter sp.]|uniref:hypothetical protein n=1 Tax=Limnobacter sp. TaxID=2003368 RepID=UPI0022C3A763|nr:hypothetical protein [Limnobacter sp.]MCZ8016027.1 hypothetical protein [Limnobacter sp.]